MKYPHPENAKLVQYQDLLATLVEPDAAQAMFNAIVAKFTQTAGGRAVFDADTAVEWVDRGG